MSKVIDQKVVEMRFDNRQFEANAKQSMSTLEKLKQSLNLKGTSKGLEDVGIAAGRLQSPMSNLGSAVDSVKNKFSAFEVMGITALANITNSAVNTGKRLVKSLSIDQVMSGWSKYGQKTSSVQTILNATGKSIEEVNEYLDKLMWFSDETSYGFTDMTAALAQMTASGGDIDKLIPLITGVANATAFAGKGASEFSRAMYNLNQSYTKGYLDYTDWKSLDLAGVSSKQLKEIIIDTAVGMGKLKKGQVTLENFATTLKDKWADTEVMEKAFGKFAEFSEMVHDAVASGEYETASDAIKELSKKYDSIGVAAFKSAQEAKTFEEAIDATKDAVSSGWMRTFEIIFGTYDKAKVVWTGLANLLWDVFASGSEDRNAWLEKVLSFDPWEALKEKLDNSTLGKIENTTKALSKLTDSVEYYRDVVNKVWRGDYNNRGDNPDRKDLLTAAGYNYDVVQALVNKGYDKRNSITQEDIAEAYKKAGISMEKATKETKTLDKALDKLNDAQLKNLGFTEEEIVMYRELQVEAKRLNIPIEELLEKMEKTDGRTLLLDSFKNAGDGLLGILQLLKEAWAEAFPPISAVRLYTLIETINKFSEKLRFTDEATGELTETAKKFKRIFDGVFALLDIITTLLGGPVKIAFKVFCKILEAFDIDILDLAANVGDAIVAFRDWMDSIIDFDAIIESLLPDIEKLIEAVKNWFKSVKEYFKSKGDTFKTFGENIVDGLSEGISGGAGTVWDAIVNLAKGLVQKFKDFLSIDSPSKVFIALGGFIIAGLIAGLTKGAKSVDDTVGGIASSLTNAFDGIDWSTANSFFTNIAKVFPQLKFLNVLSGLGGLFTIFGKDTFKGFAEGLLSGAQNVLDVITSIAKSIIERFCGIFKIESPSKVMIGIGLFVIAGLIIGIGDGMPALWDTLKELATGMFDALQDIDFKKVSNGIVGKLGEIFESIDLGSIMAAGLGIGSLSIAKKLITVLDKFISPVSKLTDAFGSIGKSFDAVTDVIKNFGQRFKANTFESIAKGILSFAIAIGILVLSLMLLTKIDSDKVGGALILLGTLMGLMTALGFAISKMGNMGDIQAGKIAVMILGMSLAMIIIASAIKKLAKIDPNMMVSAIGGLFAAVVALTVLMYAFGRLTSAGAGANLAKAGIMLILMSAALHVMLGAIKKAADLDAEAVVKGIAVVGMVTVLYMAIMSISRLAGGGAAKAGIMFMTMAGSILILIGVIRLVAELDPEAMAKGIITISLVVAIFAGIMMLSAFAGANAAKAGVMFLMMSGAILMLTYTIEKIAQLNPAGIAKGLFVVKSIMKLFAGIMVLSLLVGDNAMKAGAMLIMMAGALMLVSVALTIISKMEDEKGLARALGIVTVLMALFGGLIAVTYFAKDCAKTLTTMIVAITMLTVCLIALTFLADKKEQLGAATSALIGIIGVFALLIAATSLLKTGPKAFKRNIITLSVLAGVILALAGVLIAMSFLPNANNLVPAAQSLGVLLLSLTTSLAILSNTKTMSKEKLERTIKMVYALSGVVAILGVVLSAMSFMPNATNLIPIASSLGILLLTLSGALAIMSSTKGMTAKQLTSAVKMMYALSGVVVILGVVLSAMSFLPNVDNMITTAFSLSMLLLALSGALAIISTFTPLNAGTSTAIGALFALSGVVFVLGLILGALNGLDLHASIPTAIALGILINALSIALIPLSIVGLIASAIGPVILVGIGMMMAIIAAIGLLIAGLGAMVSDSSTLDKGIEVLGKIGLGIGVFFGNLVAGFSAAVLTIVPLIGLALSGFMKGATPFIEGLKMVDAKALKGVAILTATILALTAASFISGIASILSLGRASLPRLGLELSLFMMGALPFLQIASNINPKVMEGVKYLSEAILMLTTAELIDGLTKWIPGKTSIADFGNELAAFGVGLVSFANTVSCLDDSSLNAMKIAAEAGKNLAEMADTFPKSGGWIDAIFGGNDADMFGKQLEAFGKSLVAYGKAVNGIDPYIKSINASVKAGKSLAEVAEAIPDSGGVIADLLGDNTMDDFGEQLELFGGSMLKYGKAVNGIGAYTKSITASVDAGKALAEMADAIPNAGGTIADLLGDNSVDDFGSRLESFGKSLKAYGESVYDIGSYTESITNSKTIVETLIDMCNSIRDELDFDWGESEITKLGDGLNSLGTGIAQIKFATTEVAGNIERVKTVTTAMVDIANYVKDNLNYDAGEAEITKLGADLASFGINIASYSGNIAVAGDVSKANNSVKTVVDVVNYVKDNLKGDAGEAEIVKMGKDIAAFGTHIASYGTSIANLDVSTSKEKVKTITDVVNSISSTYTDDKATKLSNLGSDLVSFGESISTFSKRTSGADDAFTSVTTGLTNLVSINPEQLVSLSTTLITALQTIATNGINAFISMFSSPTTNANVVKAANDMAGKAADEVGSEKNVEAFEEAGKDVATGFGDGIVAKTWYPITKAIVMANLAEAAVKKALDINSPSKVFRAIGGSVPEGFAQGINKFGNLVTGASEQMTVSAVDSVKESIARISDLINSDIDSQPTIRPVLDLTDVQAGASTIGSMFGSRARVGVSGHINAISSMMNQNQNGANDDIVSAINKLRGDLSNVGGTQYNINGITYDDGSNITDAVKTIVRAARVERRV